MAPEQRPSRPARRHSRPTAARLALALLGAVVVSARADPAPPEPTPATVAVRDPAAGPPRDGEAPNLPSPGDAKLPSPAELEKLGAAIGAVDVDVDEIFDEDDPRENSLLYRLANDLHLSTREATVREQLLFQPGETFSAEKAAETARLLRERNYLSEADVVPTAYDPVTNTVDVKVRVRDVWTLEPGIGFGRAGGANKSRIRVADENFLGLGEEIALEYKSNEDRSGLGLEFRDPNVFQSRWALGAHYADNSDGSIAALALERPFYSLDSRWSAGFAGQSQDQVTSLYDLGETIDEFDSSYDTLSIQGGRSAGLVNGWTRRWLAGYRYDRAIFDYTTSLDPPSIAKPEDRLLSYPWVGFEILQDHYQTTHNHDQIGRVEDVFVGLQLRATMGVATPALGSDRSAGIFTLEGHMGRPIGEDDTLLVDSAWSSRVESGSTADSLVQAGAHYYHSFDESNLFVASLDAAHAHALDLDQQLQLGGDSGLRGYPLRYQTGDTRALLTLEERYFSDWYPWRLFRVGGAVFADVGRMWGDAPLASEPQGWLGDAGFGLRIGNARSGIGSVLHIDLAFPIAKSADIDSVQLLLQAQKSF